MKLLKRFCALLGMVVAVCLLSVHVLAAGVIDLDQDVGLTLSYQSQGTPLSGASFNIYLVATIDSYGELTETDAFLHYNVDIQTKTDVAWQKLASTLEGYVLRDGLPPTDSGKTDAQGQLSFPTGETKLTPGLYLVLGQRHTQGRTHYDPAPFLVLLPCQDQDTQAWTYHVDASVKFDISKTPDSPTNSTVNRKVLKIWKDDGENRPERITVQLLRDGSVYDTVTLNEENNWRYTWTGLSSDYKWRVVEETVPDGYCVTVSQEGITFVVTNTADTPGTPPDAPDQPDSPSKPEQPGTPKPPSLPQTGQLWWPVPLLAMAGLLMISVGLLRRKAGTYEA